MSTQKGQQGGRVLNLPEDIGLHLTTPLELKQPERPRSTQRNSKSRPTATSLPKGEVDVIPSSGALTSYQIQMSAPMPYTMVPVNEIQEDEFRNPGVKTLRRVEDAAASFRNNHPNWFMPPIHGEEPPLPESHECTAVQFTLMNGPVLFEKQSLLEQEDIHYFFSLICKSLSSGHEPIYVMTSSNAYQISSKTFLTFYFPSFQLLSEKERANKSLATK